MAKTNGNSDADHGSESEKGRIGASLSRQAIIPPFTKIMSQINEDGDFDEVNQVEFAVLGKKSYLSPSMRNYLKNQAFALMIYGGMSITEVADLLGLAKSTVSTWRSKATPEQLQKIELAELGSVNQRIANATNTCLTSAEQIAIHISRKEYVDKQDPEKMARVFETLVGFSTKLLEAKQRVDLAFKQMETDRKRPDFDLSKPLVTTSPETPAPRASDLPEHDAM